MLTLNFLENAKKVYTEATLISDKICDEWARDCTKCPMRFEKDKCYFDGFEKMAMFVIAEINRRKGENKRKERKGNAIL